MLFRRIKNDDGEACVSYVAVTVDKNLDLNIYSGRGRPTNQEKLRTSEETKRDLQKLRDKMNYSDGTEVLLAISVVTDDMTRHVAMFPEVFYLDVTANTNRQKRDLFLMVVKDANDNVFIGNATVIPSGKRWVYAMIYKNFFIQLYGELTISRNRICLTDDDMAEWGPLDDCIKTLTCWQGTINMLCMFHALTMAFFEKIHPKLPHTGNKQSMVHVGDWVVNMPDVET